MAGDPYKYFRVEANDIVDRLTQGLIAAREGAASAGATRELLRLAHTLKGAAHVVREADIAATAHAIEDRLSAAGESLPGHLAPQLLADVEIIAQRLRALGQPAAPPAAPSQPTVQPPEERPRADDVFRTVRVDVDELDQVLHGVTESMVRMGGVRPAVASLDRAASLAGALQRHLHRDRGNGMEAASARAEALAENLAETLAGARLQLAHTFDTLDRELHALAETAGQLRLVPVRALFVPMERAVLATAETLGKRVIFEAVGRDLRVEAQLLSAVRDGLLHIVRNAVVHGIESPRQREATGKPAAGRVSVLVERRRDHVLFTCTDDGAGVDIARVRRVAVERGYTDAGHAAAMSETELLQLLLRPGVSTTSQVTQVAGRGIGLDVVADAVAQLHGRVDMRTEPGHGTRVELVIPASLVSTAAVLVHVAGTTVAVPTESIRQTITMAPGDVVRSGTQLFVSVSSKLLLPYLPLARVLRPDADESPAHVAMLVESGGTLAAIGVTRLVETATVVIRALPALVRAHPVIAGAALDSEGKPLLVLDPAGLVATATSSRYPAEQKTRALPLPVLVIDDSLTTRMLEQSILEAAGYSVDLAVSGEEAMEKTRGRDYGLFLVDIEMPGMDGFEFIERTRRDPALQRVPAILVSSRSSAADRARGTEVGASDYVVKSEFDQQYLLDRIRQLVRVP